MTIKSKQLLWTLISVFVALVVAFMCVMVKSPTNLKQTERTVELTNSAVDYNSILNEFEDVQWEIDGSVTYFSGIQTLDASVFEEFDNVSESDIELNGDQQVKYDFSYDAENNIVTLSATFPSNDEIVIEEMYGVAYINEYGEIDAVFCLSDEEYITLSEMQDLGMIQNCGWFSWLVKAVVTVAAVAVCVATAGAGVAAVIAVGAAVGAASSVATQLVETGTVDLTTTLVDTAIGAVAGGAGAVIGKAVAKTVAKNAVKNLTKTPNGKIKIAGANASGPSSQVRSYSTYNSFKLNYGKASEYIENGEWHHIVEQSTIKNCSNASTKIYSSKNTVAISKDLHSKISAYYSRIYKNGMTFRQYINSLHYEQQYTEGINILKQFAKELGEKIVWL